MCVVLDANVNGIWNTLAVVLGLFRLGLALVLAQKKIRKPLPPHFCSKSIINFSEVFFSRRWILWQAHGNPSEESGREFAYDLATLIQFGLWIDFYCWWGWCCFKEIELLDGWGGETSCKVWMMCVDCQSEYDAWHTVRVVHANIDIYTGCPNRQSAKDFCYATRIEIKC